MPKANWSKPPISKWPACHMLKSYVWNPDLTFFWGLCCGYVTEGEVPRGIMGSKRCPFELYVGEEEGPKCGVRGPSSFNCLNEPHGLLLPFPMPNFLFFCSSSHSRLSSLAWSRSFTTIFTIKQKFSNNSIVSSLKGLQVCRDDISQMQLLIKPVYKQFSFRKLKYK